LFFAIICSRVHIGEEDQDLVVEEDPDPFADPATVYVSSSQFQCR
jgi:hypothetical protein